MSERGRGRRVADVRAEDVAAFHPAGAAAVFKAGDRGAAITAMSEALTRYCSRATTSAPCSG